MPSSIVALVITLALISLAAGSGAVAEGKCTPITFAPDTSGADITGIAPPEDVLCYTLDTGLGQTATIKVVEGDNIIFSVVGLIDAQNDYTFTTKQKSYEIVVGQLMRSITNEAFRISITVTGAAKSSSRQSGSGGASNTARTAI